MTTIELMLQYVRDGEYSSPVRLAAALSYSWVPERHNISACRKLVREAEKSGLIYRDSERVYRVR